MTFSEKLLSLRRSSGLSQEKLAEALSVSRQAVSRWEQGTAMPDTQNLLQLSRLFQVSIDYLLHDDFESDRDMPIVRQTEEDMKTAAEKDRNRQVAMMAVLCLLALTFFWALTGYFVFNSWLMLFPLISCQWVGLLAFELAFRRQGIPDRSARIYRLKFYRAALWLVSYFPLRFLLVTPLRHLMEDLIVRILYFPPLWGVELCILALYLLLCGTAAHRLTEGIHELQA